MAAAGLLAPVLAVMVGQAMPVPIEMQTVLFSKILKYDRTLSDEGSGVRVLVVYEGTLDEATNQTVRAFVGVGFEVQPVAVAALAEAAGAGSVVVYVKSKTVAAEVQKFCSQHKALSMTGWPTLVHEGRISVGLGRRADGRPEIVVNRSRLRAEGHDLSSQLLSLARVID